MALVLLVGIHLSVIYFFSYWIWKKLDRQLQVYFFTGLLLKLSAGIGLGLLYRYHYHGGDTLLFFDDASKLASVFWDDPYSYVSFLVSDESKALITVVNTQSRSLFFVKIVSFINLFTGSNYWITSLYFSFVSFLSVYLLFQKITTSFAGSKYAAAIAFLFFPSVVFWGSGIIKESLAVAGLFILARVYVTLITNKKPIRWEWLLALISVIIVWRLKYYWIAVFIPVAITTLLVHFSTTGGSLKTNIKILLWILSFLVFCFGVSFVHPNFYLENFLLVLVDNYNQFSKISPHENIISYQLEATWLSVFQNAPLALMSGLFRPFIWEAHNLLQVIVAMENLFICALVAVALIRLRAVGQSPHRLLIFSTVVYIVILCLFLSLSTPNLGTLSRYKIGFLPFLVFILLSDNVVLTWLNQKLNAFSQFFSKHIKK